MERYATLIGEVGPEIMGDEVTLGLPKVTNKEDTPPIFV